MYDTAMRESLELDQLRCTSSTARLAQALAPVKGIHDARVQIGHSSLLVEYDDDARGRLDAALDAAGFTIVSRREVKTLA